MTCPRHIHSLTECAALIVCPYSRAHHISPAAFPAHLRTCRMEYVRKNSNNIIEMRCRIDPRHQVPEVELEFHEKHCNDAYFRKINAELIRESTSDESYSTESDTSSCSSNYSSNTSISEKEMMFQVSHSLDV
ncbi:hypothetical protein DICVIV_11407 [Dictyocaulus viviparus]|uniref:CHHC U11-48K-type domain-containing protein n=1 Tax=Dictyocaulus viviparus TaxID=29172 RepID=A0A0D8XJR0_DICVI|nr:hypothetical protein DICVIV_11407 [Dictyocaulus viviparus]